MSYNQNGILVDPFTVEDYHQRIKEGTVVGITLGWFFGAIAFYALGMFIIWKLGKSRSQQQDSRVSNSAQQKPMPQTQGTSKAKHRKQTFQQNPTLQMVNVTDSNEVDSHQIHLGFTKNKNTKSRMQRQQNTDEHQQ